MTQQNDGLPHKPACELAGIHVKGGRRDLTSPSGPFFDLHTLIVACEPPHNTIKGIFGNSFHVSMELTIHKEPLWEIGGDIFWACLR